MLGYCKSLALATVTEMAQVYARMAPYFLFVTAATDRPSQTVQIIHAGVGKVRA